VAPETFRQQMQALRDWGYTSITASYLAQVIQSGGDLPARPFVITFDDGNLDIYSNAFPIMQELGFVGTFYIVADYLDSYNHVDAAQLQEMAAAGWEIGSHSMTHVDLTDNHALLSQEIEQSRTVLENTLGVPVRTFAYPFGARDDYVKDWTRDVGYLAGMGLGTYYTHTPETLFYLSRIEVYASYDMAAFSALIPWTQPLTSP
jgi:peptidoglycan/xylan/chitin deacetylase (PgdA/CDA1 family)